MEMMDLYDENRIPLHRTADRYVPAGEGEHRLVIHVALFSPDGKLLIQRRTEKKEIWPGRWDLSVGGCVNAGETSRQAAERECLEELGYALDLTGVRPSVTVNFEGGFDDFFIVIRDVELSGLCLQPTEVSEVCWAELDEILSMMAEGAFIPYPAGFLQFLFEMRQTFGFPVK